MLREFLSPPRLTDAEEILSANKFTVPHGSHPATSSLDPDTVTSRTEGVPGVGIEPTTS